MEIFILFLPFFIQLLFFALKEEITIFFPHSFLYFTLILMET